MTSTAEQGLAHTQERAREHLAHAIAHLDHVLPGQAPILNFVHHNTLHGYQHLPFDEALVENEKTTGTFGYLPETEFRKLYAASRISDADLDAGLAAYPELRATETLMTMGGREVRRAEVLRIAMIHGIEAVSPSQLTWLIEAGGATERFQDDVPDAAWRRILEAAEAEGVAFGKPAPEAKAAAVADLWKASLEAFQLADYELHPEDLVDLPVTLAETLLANFQSSGGAATGAAAPSTALVHQRMRTAAGKLVEELFADLGRGLSLRGLLKSLTGQDLLDEVGPMLTRFAAAHLDEGLAAWDLPGRKDGLYAAWRRLAFRDLSRWLHDLPEWRQRLSDLPDDPLDAVILGLERLGVPEDRHAGYLQRIALEIPGWAGIINWRQNWPGYKANRESPPSLTDYLALRLIFDGLWIERICRETWSIVGNWQALHAYLKEHSSEALVRHSLFAARLPEYLASRARDLTVYPQTGDRATQAWDDLADMIWTWQLSPVAERPEIHTVYRSAWRLFRLAQHLGLSGGKVRAGTSKEITQLFDLIDNFYDRLRCRVWLAAYEHHYRDNLINALANRHGQGRWHTRQERPQAQVVFCIDDREEGFRRHLEELNPRIETLGAAGFFGVVINWRGLDDSEVTALCPIVATPAHEVSEVPRVNTETQQTKHEQGAKLAQRLRSGFQEIRRNLLSSHVLIDLLAPITAVNLVAKSLRPSAQDVLAKSADARLVPGVLTEVAVTGVDDGSAATPEHNRMGFTNTEQADRVAALLRNIGLVSGFAPLVVLMAHGSISQNNPHIAAYDCGACSGRHGGPNSRSFAAMANRPVIRKLLAERGIVVPQDTWFLGAEHNTCNEEILWFDRVDLPASLQAALTDLQGDLQRAGQLSAHERCRRFASAPRDPELETAHAHIVERSTDFSQARPELGHATNAAALVGPRAMSQGVFLDRRAFLISYDPSIDPDGKILEGILLAVGPVGAGINLEYYFSTIDSERFGCGSKVPHNVTGLFAVMEGASSDLRTGLPKQMTEIHEPVRLQIVIEASTANLGAIYERQPLLRELIGNEWVHVISKDPDNGVFSIFKPGQGFVAWQGPPRPLPHFARSTDYYRGKTDPLAPVLVG